MSIKENLFTPDCIRTFTGLYMNVFKPTPEMICIEDIAHALSHQCRFGGHLPVFYSVAQHSVDVACSMNVHYRLQALMHDAAEAYLQDIPSPIKKRLHGFAEIEDSLMQVIAKKFGFDPVLDIGTKNADREALQWEWNNIMLDKRSPYGWAPKFAKRQFLTMFKALSA